MSKEELEKILQGYADAHRLIKLPIGLYAFTDGALKSIIEIILSLEPENKPDSNYQPICEYFSGFNESKSEWRKRIKELIE